MADQFAMEIRNDLVAQFVALGHPDERICRHFNMSMATLRDFKKGVGQAAVEQHRAQHKEFIEMQRSTFELLAPRAIAALEKVIEAPTAKDSDKIAAARTILDQVLPKEARTQVNQQFNLVTPEAASEFIQTVGSLVKDHVDRPVFDLETNEHVVPVGGTKGNGAG